MAYCRGRGSGLTTQLGPQGGYTRKGLSAQRIARRFSVHLAWSMFRFLCFWAGSQDRDSMLVYPYSDPTFLAFWDSLLVYSRGFLRFLFCALSSVLAGGCFKVSENLQPRCSLDRNWRYYACDWPHIERLPTTWQLEVRYPHL